MDGLSAGAIERSDGGSFGALGPLVVYSAALDGYTRAPGLSPNPALFVELIGTLGPQMSRRIACDWQTSPRLSSVFEKSGEETLATALHVGELFGTLSLLESQAVISSEERRGILKNTRLPDDLVDGIWARLAGSAQTELADFRITAN